MTKIEFGDIMEFSKERIAKDYVELCNNFAFLPKTIEEYMREKNLFEATEKHRVSLLNEVQNLKKELGKLLAVKSLMDNAGVYGYSDLLPEKDPLDAIFVDKHDAKVEGGAKHGPEPPNSGYTQEMNRAEVEKSEVKEKKA